MLTSTGMPLTLPCSVSSSMISTEVLGSSDEVGSSASSSCGRCISARAMPTRWRWPPDRASARWSAKPARPTVSSN
ncbi:Protein of uncharacterised function (DUF1602) [Bordetella pertussis]|nr:Protein of uncharacterised function (DUF1602) [Bordetella pertussis]